MELIDKVDIRKIEQRDIDVIIKKFTFPWTTEAATRAKWQRYYTEQQAGERLACVVTKDNVIVGYGSLLPESTYKPFVEDDVFEISDIWIDKAARGQGLATLLITYFESIAEDEEAPYIGMGVGLYADYGTAQQLYARLGYKPDGRGITHKGVPVALGKQYPIDDDLLLWVVKELGQEPDSE